MYTCEERLCPAVNGCSDTASVGLSEGWVCRYSRLKTTLFGAFPLIKDSVLTAGWGEGRKDSVVTAGWEKGLKDREGSTGNSAPVGLRSTSERADAASVLGPQAMTGVGRCGDRH